MAAEQDPGWEDLRERIKAPCQGCPRNTSKMPIIFERKGSLTQVDIVVVSQEPGQWLRSIQDPEAAELRLQKLCADKAPVEDVRKANPLSKVAQMFGAFDPTSSRIYWTHALKCVPVESDRAINKEWRKAATRCEEHFIDELRALGKGELNLIAFGKFALEMCLHLLEGQDMDQDISISEFMQSSRLPIQYKYKFKDGTAKTINLFVFTNPSGDVVKILKSGGKLTVEEIQDLEAKRLREILESRKR